MSCAGAWNAARPLAVVRFDSPAPRSAAANATFREKRGTMLIPEYPSEEFLELLAKSVREGKRQRHAHRARRPATPSLFGEAEEGAP
jgi:hypothetical protein